MRRRNESVSREKRLEIIREYLTGDETAKALAERYNVTPHVINVWVYRYRKGEYGEKSLSLCPEPTHIQEMPKTKDLDPTEENELLKKRVKELEASLHKSELMNLALNTMIDIAEEQGIKIRKKPGAKQ